LCTPSRRTRSDSRPGGQVADPLAIHLNPRVSRIGALEKTCELELLRLQGRHVFQAMNRKIDFQPVERLFQLLDPQTLATDLRQRHLGSAISVGLAAAAVLIASGAATGALARLGLAAATLAACGGPQVRTDTSQSYVSPVPNSSLRTGTGKVTVLLDPTGPVDAITWQRMTLKMQDGSEQIVDRRGHQVAMGETVRVQ